MSTTNNDKLHENTMVFNADLGLTKGLDPELFEDDDDEFGDDEFDGEDFFSDVPTYEEVKDNPFGIDLDFLDGDLDLTSKPKEEEPKKEEPQATQSTTEPQQTANSGFSISSNYGVLDDKPMEITNSSEPTYTSVDDTLKDFDILTKTKKPVMSLDEFINDDNDITLEEKPVIPTMEELFTDDSDEDDFGWFETGGNDIVADTTVINEERESLTKISEIATEVDSQEVVDKLNGNVKTDISLDLDEEDDFDIQIEDEIDESFRNEPSTYEIISKSKPVEQQEDAPYREVHVEAPLHGMVLTDNGPKLRKPASEEEKSINPLIIDMKNSSKDKKLEGYGLVLGGNTYPYGKEVKYRVVLDIEVARGVKTTATMFDAKGENAHEAFDEFKGKPVKFIGKFNEYRGEKNIIFTQALASDGEITEADFEYDNEMELHVNMFNELVNSINHPTLKELLQEVLIEKGIYNRMKSARAGLSMHDSARGGLLKHTARVAKLVDINSVLYPNINRDIVVTSALLHDIGKIYELDDTEYTLLGEVTGHIIIGQNIVNEAFNNMQAKGIKVENSIKINIIHCILSHHGKLEYGSPVVPKTEEALLLHQCDMIDSQITHVDEKLDGVDKAYSRLKQQSFFKI